jgi:tRNA (guanine37-N1)-methyltransferase
MFCGVGPLSVKAAAKCPTLKVLANDLNPDGVAYLKKNIDLNKVQKRVLPFNMDAREFVQMLVDRNTTFPQKKTVPQEFLRFDHCFMNLPVDAVEFLDAFIGLFNKADPAVWLREGETEIDLPLIHVYGFTFEKEKEGALKFFTKRIGEAMNYPSFKESDILCFHNIRDVSP